MLHDDLARRMAELGNGSAPEAFLHIVEMLNGEAGRAPPKPARRPTSTTTIWARAGW